MDLGSIPRCEARLRTFVSRFTALDSLSEATSILKEHTAASKELKTSRYAARSQDRQIICRYLMAWARLSCAGHFASCSFEHCRGWCVLTLVPCMLFVARRCFSYVLQAVLATGNFMNWGTPRGQAAGFRIRGLTKLQVRIPLIRVHNDSHSPAFNTFMFYLVLCAKKCTLSRMLLRGRTHGHWMDARH
jgi:hypothetical protein